MSLAHELTLRPPALGEAPETPGVVFLEFHKGAPYAARCRNIHLRLSRLLQSKTATGDPLADHIARASYEPTASTFQTNWLLYVVGLRAWPDTYHQRLKLRTPPCLKVHVTNDYPRTSITTRLRSRRALFYGPFRSRAVAERFEDQFLDFFQLRRCHENLVPTPEHPGCVYGEMGKCLRPCQVAVTPEEYRAESGRVLAGLSSRGDSLRQQLEQARDAASEALEFETAARNHDRLERLRDTIRLGDDLARDLDQLHGAIIQRSYREDEILIWILHRGFLQHPFRFDLTIDASAPTSLDARLRSQLELFDLQAGSLAQREDHLALLRRWQYSSWRKGEMVVFDKLDRLPYRKLVNAVSRVASKK